MEEWGFKDWATAETFYKSQQHQLRSTKDSHMRRLLQVRLSMGISFYDGHGVITAGNSMT